MKTRLCFFLTVLSFSLSSAQEYTRQQVQEDLRFLVDNIRQYNPALELYNPGFGRKTDSLIRQVTTPLSGIGHFGLIYQVVALSNEGHFSISDWSDPVHKGFGDNVYRYFPYAIRILEDRMFIWENYSDEQQLKPGDELLSINGRSVKAILEHLYRYVDSDGHIPTNLRLNLTDHFPWMYYLFMEQPEQFSMVYRTADGKKMERTTRALIRDEMRTNYQQYIASRQSKNEPEEKNEGVYDLKIEGDQALLRLYSFDWRRVESLGLKAKKMYRTIFEKLQSSAVKHLIVDLRNNTGGRNEFAYEMIPYILHYPKDRYFKTSISWTGKEKKYKMPKASKYRFDGKIYALVNGKTYSAGASLARYLREYGNAVTIGEETGTRYEGFAAGSQQTVYLPHAKIKIDIPRYHISFPQSKEQTTQNRGLLPEHKVNYSIEDLMSGRDKAMETANRLIGNN